MYNFFVVIGTISGQGVSYSRTQKGVYVSSCYLDLVSYGKRSHQYHSILYVEGFGHTANCMKEYRAGQVVLVEGRLLTHEGPLRHDMPLAIVKDIQLLPGKFVPAYQLCDVKE
jgi:hypothetical protein